MSEQPFELPKSRNGTPILVDDQGAHVSQGPIYDGVPADKHGAVMEQRQTLPQPPRILQPVKKNVTFSCTSEQVYGRRYRD